MSAALSPGGYVRHGQRSASPPRCVNVQVAVRCRPLNDRERTHGDRTILKCDPSRREIQVNNTSAARKVTKSNSANNTNGKRTFTYDQVFGPEATQGEVFDGLVQPIVDEVLEGYNCTVFAYGQTGTGKTHTMEGRRDDDMVSVEERRLASNAGIIPRAIKQIFDHLRSLTDEHSVRVSHLELYNEQLTDLLGPEDLSTESLRVYEDPQKGTFVQGLDDIVVRSEEEIFAVLDRSATKRKTAETLMNKFSSRSHSIFSITIHIKESTPDGADLLKVGKLNLVDLAGSENVGRSGAVKGRAREAGNINQSLLTLGRVITALVDRHPHIPYRDSKLTRLLQESLGGRNKTCVIATVTPGSSSFEETVSTLDYAYRAKNIKNRPTVNQMIAKNVLLKEYTEEISKLKRELDTTRAKNGVYLPPEEFERLQQLSTHQREEITNLSDQTEEFERQLGSLKQKLGRTQDALKREQQTLVVTRKTLDTTRSELQETKDELDITSQQKEENALLVRNHVETEKSLHHRGNALQDKLGLCVSDASSLHQRVSVKENLEKENVSNLSGLQENVESGMKIIYNMLDEHTKKQRELLDLSKEDIDGITQALESGLESMGEKAEAMFSDFVKKSEEHAKVEVSADKELQTKSEASQEAMSRNVSSHEKTLSEKTRDILDACREISSCFSNSREAVSIIRTLLNDYTELQSSQFEQFEEEQRKALVDLNGRVTEGLNQQNSALEELKSFHKKEVASEVELIKKTQDTIIQNVTSALSDLVQDSVERFTRCDENVEQCTSNILKEAQSIQAAVTGTQNTQNEMLGSMREERKQHVAELDSKVDGQLAVHKESAENSAAAVITTTNSIAEIKESTDTKMQGVQEKLTAQRNFLTQFCSIADTRRIQEQSDFESSVSSGRDTILETKESTSGQAKKLSVGVEGKLNTLADREESMGSGAKQLLERDVHRCIADHSIVTDENHADKPPARKWPTFELPRTRNHTSLIHEHRQGKGLREVPREAFDHDVPLETVETIAEAGDDVVNAVEAKVDDDDVENEETHSQSGASESAPSSRRGSSSETSDVPRTDSDASLDKLENKENVILSDTTNRRPRRTRKRLESMIRKKPTGIPLPRGKSGARKIG